jgi:hypothetical protein
VLVEAGGADLPATIEQVSPEVDPFSGIVIVVAVLDPSAHIKPGLVVRVHPASAEAALHRGGG